MLFLIVSYFIAFEIQNSCLICKGACVLFLR